VHCEYTAICKDYGVDSEKRWTKPCICSVHAQATALLLSLVPQALKLLYASSSVSSPEPPPPSYNPSREAAECLVREVSLVVEDDAASATTASQPSPAVCITHSVFISALNHLSFLVVLRVPPSRADMAALVVRIRFGPLPPWLTRLLSFNRCLWRQRS